MSISQAIKIIDLVIEIEINFTSDLITEIEMNFTSDMIHQYIYHHISVTIHFINFTFYIYIEIIANPFYITQ